MNSSVQSLVLRSRHRAISAVLQTRGPLILFKQRSQLSSRNRRYSVMSERRFSTSPIPGNMSHASKGAKSAPIESQANISSQANAWTNPGSAAFDFRSDVVTRPTANMLLAIQNTTLSDDVFAEDATTNALEAHMAQLTHHESSLFVLSGTMGNQLAMRSHLTQPPYSILCDSRAHILEWEAGGVASLCGALVKGIKPSNGKYLTLKDIEENVVLGDEIHSCPTRVISLENTLSGLVLPLSEVRLISEFCRSHAIKLHLDGARLWEAVAAGAGSLSEYTSLFDSASLCFSKGLGAPVGSILVGSEKFIKHARWVRKSIGGGLRQTGVVTAAARVAVDETFGKGDWGEGGELQGSHVLAKRIAETWVRKGGELKVETETNMVWLDLEKAGVSEGVFVEVGRRAGVSVGGRLVVHYQIGEEAVGRLEGVMDEILDMGKKGQGEGEGKAGERTYGSLR